MAVERIAPREHLLRKALTDDDYGLLVLAIQVIEIASCEKRYANRREKSRRYAANLGTRIFFTGALGVAIGRELQCEVESRVPPGNGVADCDAIDAGQLADAAYRLLIETVDLVGTLPVRVHGKVNSQHSGCVEDRTSVLHVEKSFQQHAGASQKQEGSGNLRHGEKA